MTHRSPSGSDGSPSSKTRLRARLRSELAALPPAERAALSAAAIALLKRSPLWQNARLVAAFHPLPSEPDISPLLFLPGGPAILLPRVSGPLLTFHHVTSTAALTPGPHGLLEPPPGTPEVPLSKAGLILVPGLAFTPDGRRLGRGRGFYDRALATLPPDRLLGVCFPCQIIPWLPAEPHDRPVGWLLDCLTLRPCASP